MGQKDKLYLFRYTWCKVKWKDFFVVLEVICYFEQFTIKDLHINSNILFILNGNGPKNPIHINNMSIR